MITLRNLYLNGAPKVEDVGFLYALLREREPGESISHKEMPTLRDHTLYVNCHPYAHWLIAENPRLAPVGAIYLTWQNEIGIAVLREERGKGYGTEMLQDFVRLIKPLPAHKGLRLGSFLANIHPENERSRRFFERAGFKLHQFTYIL